MKTIFTLIFLSQVSFAHSGRTNSEGCHNDRKRGEYHCHNSGKKKKVIQKPISKKKKKQTDAKVSVVFK